ncbi:hypothetical protein [Azorhizobium doebereinerae]|uniref:hypothetical protein n=1 Tax=Azorhizobium doebereinerae TaxID=281091 RepID=UPI00048D37BA|nr:hypothetical protein [Azorhizobium doebereinerae]
MARPDLSILKYWRSAAADSAIGDGCLKARESAEFHSLSAEEEATGILGRAAVDFLFSELPARVQRVSVSYRPLHVRCQSRHTYARSDGLPPEVTPIVTEAQVTREGRIIPRRSVIARDILEPLASDTFSIGRVAELGRFLTAHPFPADDEGPDLWQRHQDHWKRMMAEVGGDWPAFDPEYQIVGHGLARPATEAPATVRQILLAGPHRAVRLQC